ncbi:MAG: DNA-binding protein [Pelodictyon luteolum]|uniref:DNA-binding protein n=2 Tax=Pelodictyon luteolum TaxID=1100 RepID=A0A165M3A9_PELLU|nr:MAG: DNA-binding protein [Pelodictyon luteolum]
MPMRQFRPPMVRMQHLDRLLRNSRYPNCSAVARYFDVSPRSIRSDIRYMKDMLGAPIVYDSRRRGFAYEGAWQFLPEVLLDPMEAEALMATKKVISGYHGTPCHDEVSRALDKVLQYLPGACADRSESDIHSFGRFSDPLVSIACFTSIEDSLRQQTKMRIIYDDSSRSGAATQSTIHPYRLHFSQVLTSWYLVAWCELSQEVRTFAVSRISEAVPLDEVFSLQEGFPLGRYLSGAFEDVREPQLVKVSLRFSPHHSQWIRERKWHSSQELEDHEDGSLTLSMEIPSLEAVMRWVMRYGGEAEVVAPEELRNRVKEEIVRMGMLYL